MTDVRIGSMVSEDQGSGEAVVLVHGLGGTSNSFHSLMSRLDGFRVLRPDLPGAGRSAYRPGAVGMSGLVSVLRELMRAVGVERAHFAGHSMGTLLCQQLAAESPDLVTSLTLFGPLTEPPAAARQALKERAETARRDGMAGIANAISTGSVGEASRRANPVAEAFVRESIIRQDPMGYAAHCEALSEASAVDPSAIRCPVLLVSGEHDGVAPVAMGRELEKGIRNARLEIIPGIGHWMMVEAVARSADLLRGHLDASAGKS